MKNFAKNLPVFFLTCILFFAALLAPLGGGKASAASDEIKFDETDVLDDLRSIDGFSLSRYPFYESAEPQMGVIEFVEYCYDYRANMRNNYGLYLYVYNPNGQNVVANSVKNKVQLAVAYDSYPITEKSNAVDYEKFDLQFCSMSKGAGLDKLFYKFKIIDHKSADGKTIGERVNSMDRRYDISGIELLTEGHSNATEYGVATTYHFTGFAENYGTDSKKTPLTRNTLTTISLDLHSTTYRFPYINQNGPGHQNQLDSVYFAVPKDFNENYGELYRVKCCWDEQKTTPIIVTNRQDVYEDVVAHLGTDGNDAKYGIYKNLVHHGTNLTGSLHWYTADWAFNKDNISGKSGRPVYSSTTPYVGYAFKSNKSNIKDAEISSAEMKEWIYGHGKTDYLFSDSVDAERTKGYQEHTFTADEPFDMLTFNQTASGWEKFCLNWQQFWTGKSWDFGPEQQNPVEPIRLVNNKDFTGADTANAENLYVNTDDFNEFETFYDTNKAANNIFLLRFAVTDYYSNSASVWDGNQDDESTYIAQETVFLDFDIIELTFLQDTTETIIPVVASPIDVVSGISSPIEESSTPTWIWIVLVILFVILIVVLIRFYPVLKPILEVILKIIWWIISAPFRFIAWIIKKISAAAKKRKETKAAAPPKSKETSKQTKKPKRTTKSPKGTAKTPQPPKTPKQSAKKSARSRKGSHEK